jgi:predicted phosphodiesterase
MKEGVIVEILVVSDLHGKVPEGLEVLSQTFNGPVIFLGDIVGTDLLGKLQKIFYDGFFNPLKKLLANTNPGETSILSYPAENNQTIGEAYCCLTDFLRQIGPFEVESPSDYVWSLRRYVHFGYFISNLPEGIRQALQKDMEVNAQNIIDLMTNFTNRRQEVFVVEGNWDVRTPLDFYPAEECLPLPVGERGFYFKDFLKKQNPKVHYFSNIGQIKYHQHYFTF